MPITCCKSEIQPAKCATTIPLVQATFSVGALVFAGAIFCSFRIRIELVDESIGS